MVFVLCTTEAHKIPATIASRCQHFSFRSVDFEELVARMAWICEQEGIEADAEALAVLAQAGEGSVRDSLSALDQAIACCGASLNAAEVRALLGAFSLESLDQVTEALAASDSRPHAATWWMSWSATAATCSISAASWRAISAICWWRRSRAPIPRLIAASPAERARTGTHRGAVFRRGSDALSAALARSFHAICKISLQPRFHLEIGLVRLVQAGRLVPIEEALAAWDRAAPQPPATPCRRHAARPHPPRRRPPAPAVAVRARPPKKAARGRAAVRRSALHRLRLGPPATGGSELHAR